MSLFSNKDQYDFGLISSADDGGIESRDLRKEASRSFWWETLRLVRDVFLIIVTFILFGVFFVQPVVVDGSSMLPQLRDGERLLVNKFIYYDIKSVSFGHLDRGDIVVFWYPEDPSKSYVKRLIAFPGETVEIKEGKVFVNDVELVEPYISSEHNNSRYPFPRTEVKNHTYFVMGDNRDNSADSRTWGFVPEKYIYGRAFFRYWKPQNVGFVRHADYPEVPTPPITDMRADDLELK
ncbi:MAG: signal peptidase I [bacterium]|nr:signal peptidase I [bacterium]